MRVWDLETGEAEAVLEDHTALVFSLAVAPAPAGHAAAGGDDDDEEGEGGGGEGSGAVLLSASQDGTVKVWPWPRRGSRRWQCARTLRGHAAAVLAVAALPPAAAGGSALAASGSVDHTIRVWETGTGRLLQTLRGHTQPVDALCSGPGGGGGGEGWLFSTSTDATLRVWSTRTWAPVRVVTAAGGRPGQFVYRLALSGPHLVGGTASLARAADAAYAVRVWEVDALVAGRADDSDGPEEVEDREVGGWALGQPAGQMIYGVAAADGQVWACTGEEAVVWGS
jgi:WD40 repeat protein